MPPSKQGNNAAILIEHFGFPAVAFVDDVINSVNDHLYTASEGISRMVEGELGVSEEGEQVRKGGSMEEVKGTRSFTHISNPLHLGDPHVRDPNGILHRQGF